MEAKFSMLVCGFIGFEVDVDGMTEGMLMIETFRTMKLG